MSVAQIPGVTGSMVTRNGLARALAREAQAHGMGGQKAIAERIGVLPEDVCRAIQQMPGASTRVARALGYVVHPHVDGAYQRRDANKPNPRES